MAIEARLTLNPDDYNAALEAAKKNTENLRKEIEKNFEFCRLNVNRQLPDLRRLPDAHRPDGFISQNRPRLPCRPPFLIRPEFLRIALASPIPCFTSLLMWEHVNVNHVFTVYICKEIPV